MIRTFANTGNRFVLSSETLEQLDSAVWIDILCPSKDEETAVERALGIDVPTLEEMSEIEVSSRLYTEEGATFMTVMMLSHTDSDNVMLAPITFIHLNMGLIALKAFRAAVLGGLTSLPGALLGGVFLGVAESLAGLVLPEGVKDVVPYVLLMLALLLFPDGMAAGWRRRR